MSTKQKKGVTLTPEEAAKARAAIIVKLRQDIETLESELKDQEEQLRAYALESGERSFGPLLAYQRINPPKLTGKTGKALDLVTDHLCNVLDSKYVTKKLSLTAMMAALDSDFNLRTHLSSNGLSIEQESKLYFKLDGKKGE